VFLDTGGLYEGYRTKRADHRGHRQWLQRHRQGAQRWSRDGPATSGPKQPEATLGQARRSQEERRNQPGRLANVNHPVRRGQAP